MPIVFSMCKSTAIQKKEKYDYQLLLVRYIQERLFYRLSQSWFKHRFFPSVCRTVRMSAKEAVM